MKKFIKKAINSLGYQIIKIDVHTDLNDLYIYHSIFNSSQIENKNFYNIGAGSFRHPAWTNIDYDSEWYSKNRKNTLNGIQFDLLSLEKIPVDSGCAEVVYSSHTIEHITNDGAQNMFNEVFRMLKTGGYFRIATPNIELEYSAFKNKDRCFFSWIDRYSNPKEMERINLNLPMNKATIEQIFLHHFATSVSTIVKDSCGADTRIIDDELNNLFNRKSFAEALDYCTALCPIEIQKKYSGNHINWWSKDKLFIMLGKAGFKKIYLSGYGQSVCPVLRNTRYFDNTHPAISLYVEAVK